MIRQQKIAEEARLKRLREAERVRQRNIAIENERIAREKKAREEIERKRKEEEEKKKLDFFDYMASQMDLDKRGKIEISEILKMY